MLKNPAVRVGLLVGLVVIAVLTGLYLLDKNLTFDVRVRGGLMALYVFGMFKIGTAVVKRNPDQDFRLIIRPIFVVFLVANLLYFVYYYFLFNFIDPSLIAAQKAYFLQMAQANGQVTEENRQVFMQETMQGELTTLRAVVYNYASGAIGGFALSAAMAFILKRLY